MARFTRSSVEGVNFEVDPMGAAVIELLSMVYTGLRLAILSPADQTLFSRNFELIRRTRLASSCSLWVTRVYGSQS